MDDFISDCVYTVSQFNIVQNNIAQIKGGANIQYQLRIPNITNDVDIVLFSRDNKDILNSFLSYFISFFSKPYSIKYNGSLTVLTIGEFDIDIVVADLDCREEDEDDKSMFGYAVKKLNYGTIENYINSLFISKDYGVNVSLAPLKLEYYQCQKAIENNNFYISQKEIWAQALFDCQLGLDDLDSESDLVAKSTLERLIQRYEHQTSCIYQSLLADKLRRYEMKKDLLRNYSGGSIPNRYVAKLSRKDKKKQVSEILKSRRLYKKHKYYTRKKVNYPHVKSKHIRKAQKMYGIEHVTPETLADKTGCTVVSLKEIVRKGEGAYYSSGSRPNQTPQSWGLARLASAVTGGKAGVVDAAILKKGCPKKWLKNHMI